MHSWSMHSSLVCNRLPCDSKGTMTFIVCVVVLQCIHPLCMYETDDRYRYLDRFDIIDLGGCKCIQNPFKGSFAFVGNVVTTALLNSPAIRSIEL